MQHIASMIPSPISEPISQGFALVETGYNRACGLYQNGEKYLVRLVPENLNPIATKVARAIPETLFCLSIYAGAFKTIATAFWACKTVWVVYPFVEAAVLRFQVDKDSIDRAKDETSRRFDESWERFKPALFASASATAVFAAVFGVISLSLPMMMHASFFGLLSYLAYNSCIEENQQSSRPQSKPGVNPASEQAQKAAGPSAPSIDEEEK